MPLPTAIKNALDNLWDEIQAAPPEKEFVITRATVGQRIYKLRFYRYNIDNNNNNQLNFKIEIIRKQ